MFSEIEHHIPFVLVHRSVPGLRVPAQLAYRRDDPFAVRLSFPGVTGPDDQDLTWLLSLELLEAGLLAPVGEGDVRVMPGAPGILRLRLRSSSAEAVLEAPSGAVDRFVRACRQCVRPGAERTAYDWDQEWADVLGQEQA